MWRFFQADALPGDLSPAVWLERVLPRQREVYYDAYLRARRVLAEGAFDRVATFFAADERGPVGLAVVTGSGTGRHAGFVGVRGDRRFRGLGRALMMRVISAVRGQGVTRLSTVGVNSRNAAAMRLFTGLGFEGKAGTGIRMRRSLEAPLPAFEAVEGFPIRAIQAGDEAEWVRMKNACFREEGMRESSVEDFRREFLESPIFDFGRVFVVSQGARIVGTASAWEANYGEGPVGLIHWVGVEPEYRGLGLGRAVSIRALEELAARGYADAWLNTSYERAAAVRLYERLGFEVHRETWTYTLSVVPA